MPNELPIQTLKRKNVKRLALGSAEKKGDDASRNIAGPKRPTTLENLILSEEALDELEIVVDFELDLMPEDFEMKDLVTLKQIHQGASGKVSKVKHVPSGVIMARREIFLDFKNSVRRQIQRELQMIRDCSSEYLVKCYGAMQKDSGNVAICMEYMHVGSLAQISRAVGPLRVDVLGKIAEAILGGIHYLYTNYRIMHRNLKPSKVLVNSLGQIKLSDFSASGQLVNSVAETVVGSGMNYMAPERIMGEVYTIKSEVWSFGMILMELAMGRPPYSVLPTLDGKPKEETSILDLLQEIVNEPSPKLPESDAFPGILNEMLDSCLQKTSENRPTPVELWNKNPFIQAAKRTEVDLADWVARLGNWYAGEKPFLLDAKSENYAEALDRAEHWTEAWKIFERERKAKAKDPSTYEPIMKDARRDKPPPQERV